MFKNRRREQRGSHFTITSLEPDHRRKGQKSRGRKDGWRRVQSMLGTNR